eukprot:5807341-Prymnesium_polylepis.1
MQDIWDASFGLPQDVRLRFPHVGVEDARPFVWQEQQICVKHTDSAPTLLQLCLSVAGRAMGDLLGAANDESRIFATGFKGARVQAHTTQHILIQPTSSSPHGQR